MQKNTATRLAPIGPVILYTSLVPAWMRTLQYQLDTAEWYVSDTIEVPALTEEVALAYMQRRDSKGRK